MKEIVLFCKRAFVLALCALVTACATSSQNLKPTPLAATNTSSKSAASCILPDSRFAQNDSLHFLFLSFQGEFADPDRSFSQNVQRLFDAGLQDPKSAAIINAIGEFPPNLRIETMRVNCPVTQHADAQSVGDRLGAHFVVWGQLKPGPDQTVMIHAAATRVRTQALTLGVAEQPDAALPAIMVTSKPLFDLQSSNESIEKPQLLADQGNTVFPGAWNRPGNEPVGCYIGGEVHDRIAEYYESVHRDDFIYKNFTSVSSILKRQGMKDFKKIDVELLRLRPDIVNITKRHLYEIKSDRCRLQGIAQLMRDKAAFMAAEFPIESGPINELGTFGAVSAPAGIALFRAELPGLITYIITRTPVPLFFPNDKEHFHPQPLPHPQPVEKPVLIPQVIEKPRRPWGFEEWPLIKPIAKATGLAGGLLLTYLILSEGSRLFPARNLLPIP